jgi:hypothetical protein
MAVDDRKGRRLVVVSGTSGEPAVCDFVSSERLREFMRSGMGLYLSTAPNISFHDERSL